MPRAICCWDSNRVGLLGLLVREERSAGPSELVAQADMEKLWDDNVALYLAGRSRVTIEQVCLSIGIKNASSEDHCEIARAMERAGWHHAAPCYGCVTFWEPGPGRRFPPPWTIEDLDGCFVVKDSSGQKLGYFYYEQEPGRTLSVLTKDEARRIAAHVAKLPELLLRE
jgi:hypothetical protein